jgi:two-component system chemotaxis sensor kinase CheA
MDADFAPESRPGAVLERIAIELAFTTPGQANHADALRGLLDELIVACSGLDLPGPIVSGLAAAQGWFADGGPGEGLTGPVIERLTEWQPWMAAAFLALDRGRSVSPAPDDWPQPEAGTTVVAPPSSVTPDEGGGRDGADSLEADLQDVPVLPEGFDEEMMQLFCEEGRDLLQEIEQGVLVLERTPHDAATIDTVFRVFHTFKGNAGVTKQVVLQRVTHELESMLDAVRRGRCRLERSTIDVILEGSDLLRRFLDEMAGQLAGHGRGRPIALPVPRLLAHIESVIRAPSAPLEPRPAGAAPAAAEATAPPTEPAPTTKPPRCESPKAEPKAETAKLPSAGPMPSASTVRVDTVKLDGLIDLVGELVVTQSMVVQSPELQSSLGPHLATSLRQLRTITSGLQRTAMALRMVPVGGLFRKMGRLVRDLSLELGKEIRLELHGEDTELDRNVVEELADPLVHMIRNSADHGLESPEDRSAAGKPSTGTITLRASHQGGSILIRVEDDGRGIDPAKILTKAVERGLIAPGEIPDRDVILGLIFLPGFSTAEQVTGLSGRGVGMDVVRANIERIRGSVRIDSTPGVGSSFTITVPLTLAIIEGLLVGVGDQRYIIPTLSVRESFRPRPGAVRTVHGRGELVDVRGRLTPLLRLGGQLGVPARAGDPAEGIIVVLESGQECRCLLVDELLGKQEVVIKGLGETFAGHPVFAGAAILGDGRVGLILDVHALVRHRVPTPSASLVSSAGSLTP